MPGWMPDSQIECQDLCQRDLCQIECQNVCRVECQNFWQIECQKVCQM